MGNVRIRKAQDLRRSSGERDATDLVGMGDDHDVRRRHDQRAGVSQHLQRAYVREHAILRRVVDGPRVEQVTVGIEPVEDAARDRKRHPRGTNDLRRHRHWARYRRGARRVRAGVERRSDGSGAPSRR
jgi:hypothetical protein